MSDPHPTVPGVPVPGRPVCRHCGAALTAHQAVGGAVCSAPACQRRKIEEASRAAFQRNWDEYVERQRVAAERAGPGIAAALRKLGAAPSEVAIGVVPRQERPLVPLPAARRAGFEARLDEIIAAAFAEPLPEMDLSLREREEAAEHPLIDATCTLCQGLCCSLGGSRHAFLAVPDMQRFRLRHPEATPAGLRRHYLGRLPERSVEYACVFQGPAGCTLDREDRADLCNRYHCNQQSQLLTRLREMGASQAVIIAHEDGDGEGAEPVVAAFDQVAGLQRLAEPAGLQPGPEAWSATEAAGILSAVDAAQAQVPPPLPRPGPDLIPQAPRCTFCGATLDRHRAVSTRSCGAPACEAERLRRLESQVTESRARRFRQDWEAALARAAPRLETAARELGAERNSLLAGVVPRLDRPLVLLPDHRRAEFAAHLEEIIREAFAGPPGESAGAEPLRDTEVQAPLLDACCAACQGACCALAGPPNMAFLRPDLINRYRRREPAAGPEAIQAAYLDRIPARSVENSCVFHGARGCALPRRLRSEVCNGFSCAGRAEIARLAAAAGTERALIVADDPEAGDDEPAAVSVFDPASGLRRLPAPAQALDPGAES